MLLVMLIAGSRHERQNLLGLAKQSTVVLQLCQQLMHTSRHGCNVTKLDQSLLMLDRESRRLDGRLLV